MASSRRRAEPRPPSATAAGADRQRRGFGTSVLASQRSTDDALALIRCQLDRLLPTPGTRRLMTTVALPAIPRDHPGRVRCPGPPDMTISAMGNPGLRRAFTKPLMNWA